MSAAIDVNVLATRDVATLAVSTTREQSLFAHPRVVEADYGPLRVGVERGMVAALAIASILLTVSTVPYFGPGAAGPAFMGRLVSMGLTAGLVVFIQVSLLRRGIPSRTWLWGAATAYVLLIVVQRVLPDGRPLSAADPWPFSFGCVAFGCVAIGTVPPRRAIAGCLLVICAPTALYAGFVPAGFVTVATIGLVAMSVFLVLAVTALRNRADWADAARQQTERLFQQKQGEIALETERVRTDALIHDTVLAALLAAAATGHAPAQVKAMAEAAIEVVSDTAPRMAPTSTSVRFGHVIDEEAAQITELGGNAMTGLRSVEYLQLPENVATAVLGAAVQALVNSHKHAGPDATCTLIAEPLDNGGIRIIVADDGTGFDLIAIPPERLGVRVSILERVRDVGGAATIDSTPGHGTTVVLEWQPATEPTNRDSGPGTGVRIVSRGLLRVVLGVLIGGAVLMAAIENALTYRAYGPAIAIVLGIALVPVLLRGAQRGLLRTRTAWGVVGVGGVIIICGPIGLDPTKETAVSIAWYTCGIIAGAVMLRMSGHRVPSITALIGMLVYVTIWAGPLGMIRVGLAGEFVLLTAGLVLNHAINRVNRLTQEAAIRGHELTIWQAQHDAYNTERRRRLLRAGREAAPALNQVIRFGGIADAALRNDCRTLEQALRDEIRGKTLLNDAVRDVVRSHRSRGATVQLLDDGGLDDISTTDLDPLLDQVAEKIRSLTSSRIIIRTGHPDSDTAISIVASTPDETAVALGLDANDTIDLWTVIRRPTSESTATLNGAVSTGCPAQQADARACKLRPQDLDAAPSTGRQ